MRVKSDSCKLEASTISLKTTTSDGRRCIDTKVASIPTETVIAARSLDCVRSSFEESSVAVGGNGPLIARSPAATTLPSSSLCVVDLLTGTDEQQGGRMQPTLPQTAGTADMDMTAVQSMDWFFKKEQIYLLAQFWQQVNSPLSQLFIIIIIIISKIRKAIFGERAEGCDRY